MCRRPVSQTFFDREAISAKFQRAPAPRNLDLFWERAPLNALAGS
jgi:hypothetical protein